MNHFNIWKGCLVKMKRLYIFIIICLCLMCTFVYSKFFCEPIKNEIQLKSKYLIDILIENRQETPINFMEMGIVLNDNSEYEIINSVKNKKNKNEIIHFTINYSKDTKFFLQGTSDLGKIEPYYFYLNDYDDVYNKQEVKFYIDDNKIIKEDR